MKTHLATPKIVQVVHCDHHYQENE